MTARVWEGIVPRAARYEDPGTGNNSAGVADCFLERRATANQAAGHCLWLFVCGFADLGRAIGSG